MKRILCLLLALVLSLSFVACIGLDSPSAEPVESANTFEPAEKALEEVIGNTEISAPETEPELTEETEIIIAETTEETSEETTEEITEETTEEITEETTEATEGEGRDYILNTNTKKFHYPNCKSAAKIKDSNKKEYHGTREELIAMGYSPCGNCDP